VLSRKVKWEGKKSRGFLLSKGKKKKNASTKNKKIFAARRNKKTSYYSTAGKDVPVG